ncbi:MAG TPA: ATP-binding cassette domain-containing protein [Mycobacteriales bacterium]|jgi:ABC-2 type transport system ATP-binding protein|nr:ATP-binding cassette domain-containing protein [Mycobacteriales bacterium]HWE87921.1 ATP-binding cassette domain-containing protein [Pseudonocardiaceae bacterium]
MRGPRIDVRGIGKSYGEVAALVDITLHVDAGTVLGVLGHNGAGKTTLIDILATRIRPTTGSASVCGWDVLRHGARVRRHIGMTSQFVAVDEAMSGRANLVLIARLLGANARQAKARAEVLLEAFGLGDAATRKAGTYSGGMRRRLDLAASLIGRPDVLFLDEPTTGLDPMSRNDLWGFVEHLAAEGTTVVLTTQYLEEADRLADEVVVLAGGRVVATGTPWQLKAGLGERIATVTFRDPAAARYALGALAWVGLRPLPAIDQRVATVPISGQGDIARLVRCLDSVGIEIHDLSVTEPTLNDVYLSLHGAPRTAR